jgi:hypothetical protein
MVTLVVADVERDVVRRLTSQLDLAISLLHHLKEVRESAIRIEAIDTARGAYRQSLRVINRLPVLASGDSKAIHARLDEFREALAALPRT